MDRPLLAENFSAAESLEARSGRSLQDWNTFRDGGLRLVEYLHYVGYNGLMISVAADGSAIYPSATLEPTPRYDTGVFFGAGQDPVRKDVLEMLLRLFDREDLQLIPSLEFAAPLPELEALRRGEAKEADGIEWIGADGAPWRQNYAPRRGLAPYYNTLDPRVQEAMLRVVREFADRYAQHRALAGLALRLSARGYAQLPGPDWGMDDGTIARFHRDTRVQAPGEGPNRFAARAAFLNGDKHRAEWLQWRGRPTPPVLSPRAADVGRRTSRGDALPGGGGNVLRRGNRGPIAPVLPPRNTLVESLLYAGIDLRQYEDDHAIILLRPERVAPRQRLGAQAIDLEINQMPDADEGFRNLPCPGSLFFHCPEEARVVSPDQQGPLKAAYTWLLTQAAPSGAENRRRFVHSLAAMDSQILLDGGWMLTMGQEEAMRDVTAIYRRLPAVRFAAAGDRSDESQSQPVTFRYAACQGRTYMYAVNDAPFAVAAQVQVDAPQGCQLQALAGPRLGGTLQPNGDGFQWQVELGPYELAAAALSEPEARLHHPRASIAAAVESSLALKIRQLGARAAALRAPSAIKALDNPGFERPATAKDPVPGWAVSRRPGVSLQLDATQKHGGSRSVRISSDGPVACLVSRWFEPPTTGRLCMSVWLRVADAAKQPPLRLAVEGKLDGRDYYKFAALGQAQIAGQPAVAMSEQWRQYIFPLDDLPLEGLSLLHVRFDLMGQGEVWVDDVQLFDLRFNDAEMRALYKLVTLADVTLQNGQIGDCMKLLDGYWPRFLVEHVPLPPDAEGAVAGPAEEPAKPAPPPQTGLMDRVKNLVPENLRF